jgi:hypothetical protein
MKKLSPVLAKPKTLLPFVEREPVKEKSPVRSLDKFI